MIPYHPCMYPDTILYFKRVEVTSPSGGPRRTFPNEGVPSRARVQSKDVMRADGQGRVYTTTAWRIVTPEDVNLTADDKVEYLGRTLVPEGRTLPKGLGNVTWLTSCKEVV